MNNIKFNNIKIKFIFFIYNIVTYVLIPFILFSLIKKTFKNKQYCHHWQERWGKVILKNSIHKPVIWVHTVSVGETKAAQALIALYQNNMPQYQILITVMSITGRQTATNIYQNVIVCYLPYDFNFAMHSFFNKFKPRIGIIFETEIWPNLLKTAYQKNIPVFLVNARLSYQSYKRYKKFRGAIAVIINHFTIIMTQNNQTAQYFKQLGYKKTIHNIGNTKFDITDNQINAKQIITIKQKINTMKTIICFASSRDHEEKILLDCLKNRDNTNNSWQDVIFLLIPRHPERFTTVEKIIKEYKFKYQKRSNLVTINKDTQIILGDSMGELLGYYAVSKIAIIGGSFQPLGGQNPLEATFMSKPVIFGPHMFNFSQISQDLLASGLAFQSTDMKDALDICRTILKDKPVFTNKCHNFIHNYSGASKKIIINTKPYLLQKYNKAHY